MRELLFLLLALALIVGGGWALFQQIQEQQRTIRELTARIESGERLAKSADEATTKVIERQTVILREADRGKAEIAQAVGAGEVVPPDVWRATRDAIERMRGQAGSAPSDRDPGVAS